MKKHRRGNESNLLFKNNKEEHYMDELYIHVNSIGKSEEAIGDVLGSILAFKMIKRTRRINIKTHTELKVK